MEAKPNRLSPEEQIKQALNTCEEAYLDEVTGNRVNGAVIGMTYEQAVGRLSLLRAQGENEIIYQDLIQAAVKKRGG